MNLRVFVISAFLLLFVGHSAELCAQQWKSSSSQQAQSPFADYWQAKRQKKLRKLSIPERVLILDSARAQAKRDTVWPYIQDPGIRNRMIMDVVVKTPARDIPVLLDSMHTNVTQFTASIQFLSAREMRKVTRHLNASVGIPDSNSRIFTSISYLAFQSQLRLNLSNRGDSLFQSHSTNFCGKIALARLWIQKDSSEYKRFMTELYYNGRADWNGTEFVTPPEVIDAVNEDKITWDPGQKAQFSNEEMPAGMDMVFYLTLTAVTRSFPYSFTPYDPDLHHENGMWAATAINPQLRLFRSMGFEAEKVGNNVRGITDRQFAKFKSAADSSTGKKVFLLVNSSIIDTLSGADSEYVSPRGLEHPFWGTHWISVEAFDEQNDSFVFWEYGRRRKVRGIEQLKHIIAGGIIVNDYNPQ
ncbi:MAG: hypothetical protein RL007_1956 [Bacteroidota bacterium]|jgi:hypothetical protein